MNAPAARVPQADETSARGADRRQAEYYRRLLHQRYLELCETIASHHRLVIGTQQRRERSEASRMRRILRDEQRECDTVRRLIEALDARFFADAPTLGPAAARSLATVSPR
jgi:hypothetical protein